MTSEERLIELESRITFLENYINEINTVVIEQEQKINKLTTEYSDLKKQISAEKEALPEGEKPPHY